MKARLFKTIAKCLILGVAILAFAGTAQAATYMNLYGASAQYNFWSNFGCTYLKSDVGCSACNGPYITSDGNSAVVVGTGCPTALSNAGNVPPQDGTESSSNDYLPDSSSITTSGIAAVPSSFTADNGSGMVYFSYSNKASWDGVDAVLGVYDTANNGFVNPCSESGADNSNGAQRPVATCNYTAGGCGTAGAKGSAIYVCQAVHIGTSDVESTAFTQKSTGYVLGPNSSGSVVTHNFGSGGISVTSSFKVGNYTSTTLPVSGTYTSDANAGTYANYSINQPEQPIAYPFSFYVNSGVQSYRCASAGASGYAQWSGLGQLCYDDSWCGGTAGVGGQFGGGSNCTAQTIDNLSRLQVVALFSGSVTNWDEFGTDFYPSKGVVLCLRHAGSGTLATLDWGVMKGNGWGTGLVTAANRTNSSGKPAKSSAPITYFNNGTSDMKNCLAWADGNATYSGGTWDTTPASTSLSGGVGFMDSDNANSGGDYIQVKFNGIRASRVAMHDGIYDDFWTVNRMYTSALSTQLTDLIAIMVNVANVPGNINTATVGSTRAYTYGASSELNYAKPTSGTYPNSYSGAANQATPN
jgi:hypothetical protein